MHINEALELIDNGLCPIERSRLTLSTEYEEGGLSGYFECAGDGTTTHKWHVRHITEDRATNACETDIHPDDIADALEDYGIADK